VKWVAPAIALLCLLFLLIALALKTIRQKDRNQPESAGFTPLAAGVANADVLRLKKSRSKMHNGSCFASISYTPPVFMKLPLMSL
jgi:hypothetical protein